MATYEELRPGLRHFKTTEIGKVRNPNGTYSRITRGDEYFETKLGLIREDKWTEIAYQAVKENNDLPLLDVIETYVREHCLWLKEREIRTYALDCLLHKSYLHWKDFPNDTKGENS